MRRTLAAWAVLLALAGPAGAEYIGGYSFGTLPGGGSSAAPSPSLGAKTIYAADPTYGVVCDGATNNDAALALIATAVATGGYDIVLPNTGASCKYTTWNLSSLTNIRIRGGAGFSNNSAAIGTALECTRTDAAVCLNVKDNKGLVVEHLTIIKADAHTGIVVDASSTASTWNKNRFQNVEFRRASGTGRNGTLLYARNTVDITFDTVRFSHAANAVVDGFDGETTTGSAVRRCASCDFVDVTVTIRNIGSFWSFDGGAWEQTLTGAPAGLLSQAADTPKGLVFNGVVFADATAAGRWMTFNGGVWGFKMSGGSMSGNVALTDGILFAGAAAGTQGVSISGVNFAGLVSAITFTGTCAGTSISGNVFTSVTNKIVNGSGSCYTSNWWAGNAPDTFNNSVAGTILTGTAGAGQVWTSTPTLGITGTITGAVNFKGTTSGTVTLSAVAAAGTYNWNLPISAGTAGSPLLSGGGGAAAQTYGGAMSGVTTVDTTGNVSTTLSTNTQVKHAVVNVNAGASANAAHTLDTNAGTYSSVAASTAGGGGYGSTWTGAGGITINQANAAGTISLTTGVAFTPRLTIANAGDVTIPGTMTMPKLIGGTTTTSSLTLQSTSGVGTTGADILFKVGNNGATDALRINHSTVSLLSLGIAASSSWGTAYNVLQFGSGSAVGGASATLTMFQNLAFDNTNWKYLTTAAGALQILSGGNYEWYTTPSGTAGNNATITLAMKLVNQGGLSVGATALVVNASEIGMNRMTAAATAPGASGGKIAVLCGTNAGTAKIVAYAGTSSTAVTVLDNIGAGVSGC